MDHLLYATVEQRHNRLNNSSQRDYELTLEMVNMHSGEFLKESAKIRKDSELREQMGNYVCWARAMVDLEHMSG